MLHIPIRLKSMSLWLLTKMTCRGRIFGIGGRRSNSSRGSFDVNLFTDYARVPLNWPGSVDLIIVRSDGSKVDLGIGLENIL